MIEFPMTKIPAENQDRLRLEIEVAVRNVDAITVIDLLRLHGDASHAIEFLGTGFGGDIKNPDRTSFASFCLTNGAEAVLSDVLRSNLAEPAVILKSVCSYKHTRGDYVGNAIPVRVNHQTLTYTAMAAQSVAGTMLALEFEADAQKMKSAIARYSHGVPMSYHAEALRTAMSSASDTGGGFFRCASICRCYIKLCLPILRTVSENNTPINCALYEFVDTVGNPQQPQLGDLFREYLNAGYFDDINTRFPKISDNSLLSETLPLTSAILRNNIQIAAELILAGADTSLVCEDVGCSDIGFIEFVRKQNRPYVEDSIAKLTHAIMTRALHVRPATNTQRRAPAPGDSRRRKLSV